MNVFENENWLLSMLLIYLHPDDLLLMVEDKNKQWLNHVHEEQLMDVYLEFDHNCLLLMYNLI